MLVGNKCDDSSKREVSDKTGQALQVKLMNFTMKSLLFTFELMHRFWLKPQKLAGH